MFSQVDGVSHQQMLTPENDIAQNAKHHRLIDSVAIYMVTAILIVLFTNIMAITRFPNIMLLKQ